MKNAVRFFYEVKTEFSKVVWPSFDTFVESTVVVLVLVVAFSIYLGFVDKGFDWMMQYIFGYY